ncbi:MAG: tol-pal system protein YbgF, partial [Stellaceae bacterium]
PVPVNPPDGPAVLSAEVRLDQVDDEIRQLTGQVQDIANSVDQLKHRLDTLSSDVDQRFASLGKGDAASAAVPPPRTAGAAPPPPPAPGTLGTLHANPPANAQAGAAPHDLPSGTPLEQYNYAFGLLRRADYPDAERMLKAFVAQHPNDPLAANAQYWLGQVYLTRKNYQDAATAFAVGYQKYPKSPKAAENLLSLGMSLGGLGKKQDACAAFARLDRDFPSAAPNIKEREAGERQRLGCT